MAQQFTHTPTAPHAVGQGAQQRYFSTNCIPGFDGAGENIQLMRFAFEDKARLSIQTYGHQAVCVDASTRLDANQCEALARYLLNAAHDLRIAALEVEGGAA